jgi:hypothetical protein
MAATTGFTRFSERAAALVERFPWIGWAGWAAFCILVLARMHPRRFAAAFGYYLEFAQKFAARETLYDPKSLTDVSYWPSTLAVMVPFTLLDPTVSAAIVLAVSAAALTWAAIDLMRALKPSRGDALMLAGLLLMINIMPAWYHFKHVQLHILMTAGMMAAAACMIREKWMFAALWLFVALVVKPIAIVMVLLCGALEPKMRLPLIVAVVAASLLPFALADADYLIEQYRLFGLKLWTVASSPPGEWPYQADFSTLLKSVGIVLPGAVSVPLRLAAALGTLWLAWRVSPRNRAAFALGILVLSGCYLTLFGPRNENVSFLVLTPSIAALALLMLLRDQADLRAWLLVAATFVLGFVISPDVDSVTKPAIVTVIYVWVASLMVEPARWRALVEGRPGTSVKI